jgi:flagellar hook-associated protein 2
MPSFQIGGIVSGIDTEEMITQILAASKGPRTVLENKIADLEELQASYEELASRLTDLQTALEDLDTESEFRSLTGTSSSDAVEVEVSGDGVAGTYSIQVNQLAASEIEISDGFSDKESTGVTGTGTFTVTYAGVDTDITVDAGDSSLEGLAALINEQVEGVTAYIMDTGDATNPYRLVISGNDTGAANTIEIDASGLSGGSGTFTFTEAVTAADSEAVINGVTITDSDTTIDDVIQGVTFELTDTTTTAATVRVKADVDTMVDKISTFVDAYNSVISYIGLESIYDEDSQTSGPFIGETTISRLTSNLRTAVAAEYSASSIVTALSQIGFATQQTGKIELDTDALTAALQDNLDDVTAIFTDSAGFNAAIQEVLDNYNDDSDGFITNRIDSLGDQINNVEEDIDDFDERMEAYEERLRNQFTAMEIALGKLAAAQDALDALLPSTSSNSSS